ncbi:MAG: CBS domain-containing protein [Candidatus Saccharibacteria bacterium]|nr:CBS domain-containing protein [Candidatus Saccharibacteria bacterium]
MTMLLWVCYGVLLVVLLIVMGVHPQLSSHSRFELQRRAKNGDNEAALLLKRHTLLRDIFSLQRVLAAILLVLLSVIGLTAFHWAPGFLISLLVALESGAVARLKPLQQFSQRLYEQYEGKILTFIEKHPLLFQTIRSVAPLPNDAYDIESKEELLAMVAQSGDVLSRDEKKLITNGLQFGDMVVSSVMTPKSMIETVAHNEVLGPLVLDKLHKTGYSRFPVMQGDIDHIVGVLYIQDLLTIGSGAKTHKVSTVMDKQVFYIHQDQNLQQALAAFLRTRHHLFVVINEYRETVGLLSLEDVIEALLGRKINDEFDTHEDLRKVAARNPRGNNLTKTAETI